MLLRHASVGFCAVLLLAAPAALAGKPGTWTKLGQSNLDNIDEAALARTADGTLHAAWTIPGHNNGGAGDSVVHDAIAANGAAAAPPDPITAGWAAITAVPPAVARRVEPTTPGGADAAVKTPSCSDATRQRSLSAHATSASLRHGAATGWARPVFCSGSVGTGPSGDGLLGVSCASRVTP
jgi:hypothetical protein